MKLECRKDTLNINKYLFLLYISIYFILIKYNIIIVSHLLYA